jgi:hypothetical protein
MKALEMLRVPDTEAGKKDASWIQNAHVALWLLKDASWCSHWHWVGLCVTVPTLALASKIAWDSRKNVPDLIHNLAVCSWICANITWMVGEFFMNDGTRPHAKVFFHLGLVVLLGYYAYCLIKKGLHAHRLRHSAKAASRSKVG